MKKRQMTHIERLTLEGTQDAFTDLFRQDVIDAALYKKLSRAIIEYIKEEFISYA